MTFAPGDNVIWGTMFGATLFFSVLAVYFPLRSGSGPRVMPGVIWLHLRAMTFPFFASISWYIMAAFAVAAGSSGTNILYYYFFMFFLVFLVEGFAMTFYLAFNPIVEVLQGREKLEDG